MGKWYDYNIKPLREGISLPDKLTKLGIGKKTDANDSFQIQLEKLSPSLFTQMKEEGYQYDTITIGTKENSLYYVNKWVPDDRIADAISKAFPDEILLIRRYGGPFENISWYMKNGQPCDAKGKSIIKNQDGYCISLFNISSKLLKEQDDDTYRISLPIGDGTSKWVSFSIPKECVIQEARTLEDGTIIKLPANIFFTSEIYKAKSGQTTFDITARDIFKKYVQSKEEYRNKMHEPIYIDCSKISQLVNRGDYYIAYLPCPISISSNGLLSITVSSYDVNNNRVFLGERGKERNAMVTLENGEKVTKRISNPDILKYVEDMYRIMHPVQEEITRESLCAEEQLERD